MLIIPGPAHYVKWERGDLEIRAEALRKMGTTGWRHPGFS